MREEEEPNWFARWEEQLPTPEELMPLSQSLITPDLALAFDIPTPSHHHHHHHHHQPPTPSQPTSQTAPVGGEYESADPSGGGGSGSGGAGGAADEPARTLKRPRLVWTPQLHKRFVDAVAHLGIKNAVPKTIMQLMSVDGLTRENVASHLQKYRLYLKRMQGLSSSGAGGGGSLPAATAEDQLFASAPVPHHFLGRGPEPYAPFVPVAALQQQHPHIVAAQHQQYYHQHHHQQRHVGHFGSPPSGGGGFDHGFLARAMTQPGMHRMVGPGGISMVQTPLPGSYADDLESGTRGGGGGGRRELTLFPTGDD